MKKVIGIVLIWVCGLPLMAQTELVLRKGYSAREVFRFKQGDSLRFELNEGPEIYSGIIEILGDSTFLIADLSISYESISTVYILRNSWSRRVFLKGLPSATAQASMFLFVYGNINAVVYGLWTKEYLTRSVLRSVVMLSGAWVTHRIYMATQYKKCSLGKYRIVRVTYP